MGALEQVFIDLFFTPAGSILGLTLFIILTIGLTVARREFSFVAVIMSALLMMMYFDYMDTYPIFAWNIVILLIASFFNGLYAVSKTKRR